MITTWKKGWREFTADGMPETDQGDGSYRYDVPPGTAPDAEFVWNGAESPQAHHDLPDGAYIVVWPEKQMAKIVKP